MIADEVMTGWGRTGSSVCLRAGGHHSGYPLHVQGADRRVPCRSRRLFVRPKFSMRICRRIAAGRSFIRAPIPPIRSPAPPRWPIWRSGRRSRWRAHPARLSDAPGEAAAFQDGSALCQCPSTGTIIALDLNVSAGGYLSECGAEAQGLLSRAKSADPAAWQRDLSDAALLRDGGRSRPGL